MCVFENYNVQMDSGQKINLQLGYTVLRLLCGCKSVCVGVWICGICDCLCVCVCAPVTTAICLTSLTPRLLRFVTIVSTILTRSLAILILAAVVLVSRRRGGMMLVAIVILILGRFRWALRKKYKYRIY